MCTHVTCCIQNTSIAFLITLAQLTSFPASTFDDAVNLVSNDAASPLILLIPIAPSARLLISDVLVV